MQEKNGMFFSEHSVEPNSKLRT